LQFPPWGLSPLPSRQLFPQALSPRNRLHSHDFRDRGSLSLCSCKVEYTKSIRNEYDYYVWGLLVVKEHLPSTKSLLGVWAPKWLRLVAVCWRCIFVSNFNWTCKRTSPPS
jgi:hypothetical protein